jgi:hypothetical protein
MLYQEKYFALSIEHEKAHESGCLLLDPAISLAHSLNPP